MRFMASSVAWLIPVLILLQEGICTALEERFVRTYQELSEHATL